ncbi:MAG TPA: CvpA family protein [Rhizobiales bacterium]|nr:CvpA family protein [Hyphomicrobiales bacterium]
MASPLTALDIMVIVILLVSGGLAMLRGFTREVLSIVSWVAAAAAVLFAFPAFQPQMREMVQPKWLADISLAAGIFLVVLIVISFITMKISDKVLDSKVGALDRTLGFIFGVVRGFVLVVVAYLFFVWLVPPKQYPDWIANARSLPIMKNAGARAMSWLPDDPKDLMPKSRKKTKKTKAAPTRKAKPGPAAKPSAVPDSKKDPGYKNSQRQGMQQLLESTTGQ